MSAADLKMNYKRVLIFESYSAQLMPFKQALDSYYRPQLSKLLAKHGIEHVSSKRYFEIFDELKNNDDTVLFDPVTGQKNDQQHQVLVHSALAQVKAELNLDAFVTYGVKIRKASFSNNIFSGYTAKWDGVSEPYVYGGAGAGDFFKSFVVQEGGNVPAASFYILFEDENEGFLAYNAGGIEIFGTFNGDEYIAKEESELFDDIEQIKHAFMLASKILNEDNE